MNNTDIEYQRLLRLVQTTGRTKHNRTGIDTIGVFGAQARFNLSEGFPLLTTKKVWFKGIIHELLWFLSGNTNIKYLVDNDVHIWDEWAYKKYKDFPETSNQSDCVLADGLNAQRNPYYRKRTMHEFLTAIRNSDSFAEKWGDLGEGTYGGMWRAFPYASYEDNGLDGIAGPHYDWTVNHVDQIQKVIDKLKTNPDDRRLIVTAWHPYWVDHCALPPCHCLFQFNTEELTLAERATIYYGEPVMKFRGLSLDAWNNVLRNEKGELELDHEVPISKTRPEDETKHMEFFDSLKVPRRRLNCQLYQRSCDLFLGVPFNIASYSLLLAMVAQVTNMQVGDFIHTYGDLHIYKNHIEQINEQQARVPKALPKLVLNPAIDDVFKFTFDDIKIEGYDPHPAIKGVVAV